MDIVAGHGGFHRRPTGSPIGVQLIQTSRLENITREYVSTDLGYFFHDNHRQVAIELHQAARRRETGRASSDDNYVKLHRFAFGRFGHGDFRFLVVFQTAYRLAT